MGRGSSARSSSCTRGRSASAAARAPGRVPGRSAGAAAVASALGCSSFSPGSSATSWNGEDGNFGRLAVAAVVGLHPIGLNVFSYFPHLVYVNKGSICNSANFMKCSLKVHTVTHNRPVSTKIQDGQLVLHKHCTVSKMSYFQCNSLMRYCLLIERGKRSQPHYAWGIT